MEEFTLTEYPDLKLCPDIWRQSEIYPEDQHRIKDYCDAALEHRFVAVIYKTKFGAGRLYPTNKYLTATTMWGRIRATLFGNTELDIDIVNCHACILLDIIEYFQSDFNAPLLRDHVENRDNIIAKFPLHRGCPYYCVQRGQTITKKKIVKSCSTLFCMAEPLRRGSKNGI